MQNQTGKSGVLIGLKFEFCPLYNSPFLPVALKELAFLYFAPFSDIIKHLRLTTFEANLEF
jgi:hypothetical protein